MLLRPSSLLGTLIALTALVAVWQLVLPGESPQPHSRELVRFWHFWGGADRATVEDVCRRFNESQEKYYVHPIAMPGNNLDLKFFLSVTGGDPPDLLNIDDPVIADWGDRGAIQALDEVAPAEDVKRLEDWLFPSARRLVSYQDRLYGVPNGLDVRALYCNTTMLKRYGLAPPTTLAELDNIAETIAPPDQQEAYARHGYLPDSRRLWAWGPVFGGNFYEPSSGEVSLNDPKIVAALKWMASYKDRYGAAEIASFRQQDQSLPGKVFPLFAGRYAVVMDGQWRVRDIRAFQRNQQQNQEEVTQFEVVPLPPPAGGRTNAGWVNGNNFVIPRGARNSRGAWEFIKFWAGFDGNESDAARTAVSGGWIPVSQQVVDQPEFQQFLAEEPMFAKFVELAGSENQFPVPVIPGAPLFNSRVKDLGEKALLRSGSVDLDQELKTTQTEIQAHIEQARRER